MICSSSHLKHQHTSARLSSLASITSSPQPACRRANARKFSFAPCRSSSLGGAALPTSSRIRSSLSTVLLPGATSVLPPERRGAPPTAQAPLQEAAGLQFYRCRLLRRPAQLLTLAQNIERNYAPTPKDSAFGSCVVPMNSTRVSPLPHKGPGWHRLPPPTKAQPGPVCKGKEQWKQRRVGR